MKDVALAPRNHTTGTTRVGELWLLGIALVCLLAIPFKIAMGGYAPPDDCLRHVTKAVSGREWSDVLVLRPGVPAGFDTHPGWHALLGALHRQLGWGADALVSFSVIFLFFVFCFVPAAMGMRIDAWLAALFVGGLLDPGFLMRMAIGRPFVLSICAGYIVLSLWDRTLADDGKWTPSRWMAVVAATTVAAFCHSTWYLLFLPVIATLVEGRWRVTFGLALAVVVGVCAGALLTGAPWDYLFYQVKHLYWTMLEDSAGAGRSEEMRPWNGNSRVAVLAVVWLALRFTTPWGRPHWRHPALVVGALGWALGWVTERIWMDWGFPCLLFWLAVEIEDVMERWQWNGLIRRFALTAALGLGLFLSVTNLATWRSNPVVDARRLKDQREQFAGWLPGEGGIVYSTSMRVFYTWFYLFPKESWRYAPGFEQGLLPPKDAAVYRAWRTSRNPAVLAPWARALRPEDRLVVFQEEMSQAPTGLAELQWRFFPPSYWIGRKPR